MTTTRTPKDEYRTRVYLSEAGTETLRKYIEACRPFDDAFAEATDRAEGIYREAIAPAERARSDAYAEAARVRDEGQAPARKVYEETLDALIEAERKRG